MPCQHLCLCHLLQLVQHFDPELLPFSGIQESSIDLCRSKSHLTGSVHLHTHHISEQKTHLPMNCSGSQSSLIHHGSRSKHWIVAPRFHDFYVADSYSEMGAEETYDSNFANSFRRFQVLGKIHWNWHYRILYELHKSTFFRNIKQPKLTIMI